jgi:hypothetical protein
LLQSLGESNTEEQSPALTLDWSTAQQLLLMQRTSSAHAAGLPMWQVQLDVNEKNQQVVFANVRGRIFFTTMEVSTRSCAAN